MFNGLSIDFTAERKKKMKANVIKVKFEPKWILEKQTSGKSSVVDDVLGIIKEKYADCVVVIINKEFHQCSVIVAMKEQLTVEAISSLLKEKAEGISDADVAIEIEEMDKEELTKVLADVNSKLNEKERDFFEKEFQILIPEKEKESSEEEPEEVSESVEDLIGMESLKKWIEEIEKMTGSFKDLAARTNIIKNFAYIVSINRGNGLTTALKLMAQTLKKSGLVEIDAKRPYVECKFILPREPDDMMPINSIDRIIHAAASSGDVYKGIMAVDIEEWIDNLYDRRFEMLLNLVWENRNNIIFVFTVPFVDNTTIEKIYCRIDDVISARVMKFVPFTDEQYFKYFAKMFEEYNITVEDSAYNAFVTKIIAERNDGKFYGFNTVKKIFGELMYGVIAEAAKADAELPATITGKDFDKLYGVEDDGGIPGIEQLRGMVALTEVKDKVKEILSMVKLQKELYAKDKKQIKPCYHMMFSGNPGTGKTVVARIIGRIFKEEGLLQVGHFFEVSRKDLIGKFVGHTASKTMAVCRNAYGSVLFIDEAYLLAEEGDSFSSEAIGTLIAEMENNRDNMVVIFAGYEKELEELFDMNPGLRDRIPHKINFPNYTREELEEIFYLQMKSKIKYDEGFKRKVNEFFANLPDEVMNTRDFSNGRFVRNLVERIVSKAALRFEMASVDIEDFELTENDFAGATSDADFRTLLNKSNRTKAIGF